jgi:hypothetical protein
MDDGTDEWMDGSHDEKNFTMSFTICNNLEHMSSLVEHMNSLVTCHWGNSSINNYGNPSTKSTRHAKANVNTRKENQDHQNNNNEMEDVMLKGHPLPQIS